MMHFNNSGSEKQQPCVSFPLIKITLKLFVCLWNSKFDNQHAQPQALFHSSCILSVHTTHLSSHFYTLPIVHRCPWVVAALHFDHQQGEEKEEHGHTEAHTVHSFVTNEYIAIHVAMHTRNTCSHPSITKSGNL